MDADTRAWWESVEADRTPEDQRLQLAAIGEHRAHWDRFGECPFCHSRPFLDQHDIAKHVDAWKKRTAPSVPAAPPAGGEGDVFLSVAMECDVPDRYLDEVARVMRERFQPLVEFVEGCTGEEARRALASLRAAAGSKQQ